MNLSSASNFCRTLPRFRRQLPRRIVERRHLGRRGLMHRDKILPHQRKCGKSVRALRRERITWVSSRISGMSTASNRADLELGRSAASPQPRQLSDY
jgi:hypothetical protein